MQSAISIRNLSHHFGARALRKQILFDISADVYPGEIVINTGPSGSGKTTLLTVVGGLRSVQQGSVQTLDTELNGASRETLVRVRQRIGFIFQAHNLLDVLTARQNVQMGLGVDQSLSSREARQRSVDMLGAVGLSDWIDHYPHQLSGGQKQRVAVARALVRRPKIVLADEPTAALDKETGREVVDLLKTLAKEQGCAILLVTHDHRILDVADRILTLEDGRISSFTAGIAANTEHLLTAFASMQRNGQLEHHLKELSDDKFVKAIENVTHEFEALLRTLDVANADATRALLEQVLEVMASRMRDLLDAERATVYLVDVERGVVRSKVAHHTGTVPLEIQMPIGTGIAGRVAQTGETMNIADPYAHPDFNPAFDRASAATREPFRTRSILCLPVFDRNAKVVGVVQMLNKLGSSAFSADDERVLQEFTGSLGIILETCSRVDLNVAEAALSAYRSRPPGPS